MNIDRASVRAACVMGLIILISSGVPASEQSTISDANTHERQAARPAIVLTPSQKTHISHAQADVDRLGRELASARKRLEALQLDVLPPNIRTAPAPNSGARVYGMATGNYAFPALPNTVGFEHDDIVVFVHSDLRQNLVITGFGRVGELLLDSMQINITRSADERVLPQPGDEAYVISRADSPYSLAKHSL